MRVGGDSMETNTTTQETTQQEKTAQQETPKQEFPKKQLPKEGKRYITAILLLIALAVILYFHNQFLIWISLGICFILGFRESLALFKLKHSFILYAGASLAWILCFFNASPILSGVFVLMIFASFLAYKKSISPKTLLPFIYPTIPFLALYALYSKMGGFGVSCLIWLVVIVAFTDTGAFFGGRIFGSRQFSLTSPNKTLEGAGIGIALGVIAGSIAGIGPSGGFIPSLLISIGVSIASVFGDLFESYLKREADVKDSGKILPGHGGILDRFDGILFGALAMYYLLGFLPIWQQL